jgi:RNA polymerase sigma factor (sigma-70 family)
MPDTTDVGIDSDDEADWRSALGGDGEAFGRVFDRHRERIYRRGYRLVPTPADADDVVAIAFLEAWRRRDSIRFVEGSMLPWLLMTATNASRNLSRSSRRYSALLWKLPPETDHPDPADGIDDGETQVALRALSLDDQRIVTLCVLEGYSEREAAIVLGIPPGTVKSRLFRAKGRLRRGLPIRIQEVSHEH